MKKNKITEITIKENEAYLRQISLPVDVKNDKDLKKDIEVLHEYCKENEVMAMAAVQLGIPKRIIYLKNTNLELINKVQTDTRSEEEKNYNESKILINPVILNKEGLTKYWESCASCMDNCGLVLRPYKIKLQYQDEFGNTYIEEIEGFKSTVLSHEIDHLDGILHIDISEEILILPASERKKLRQTEGYEIISTTGDYENLKLEQKK